MTEIKELLDSIEALVAAILVLVSTAWAIWEKIQRLREKAMNVGLIKAVESYESQPLKDHIAESMAGTPKVAKALDSRVQQVTNGGSK